MCAVLCRMVDMLSFLLSIVYLAPCLTVFCSLNLMAIQLAISFLAILSRQHVVEGQAQSSEVGITCHSD